MEGNKLIAEFMGATKNGGSTIAKDGSYTDLYELRIPGIFGEILYYDKPTKEQIWAIESLAFHSDWSWLMPVVEKIESMGCKVCLLGTHCTIYNAKYNVNPFEGATKIEAAYTHVIDFISWYNSNHKEK